MIGKAGEYQQIKLFQIQDFFWRGVDKYNLGGKAKKIPLSLHLFITLFLILGVLFLENYEGGGVKEFFDMSIGKFAVRFYDYTFI